MIFIPSTSIKKDIQKVSTKKSISEEEMKKFKDQICLFYKCIKESEKIPSSKDVEETQRGYLKTFLERCYYDDHKNLVIEEKENRDLSILGGMSPSDKCNILIETKSTTNTKEMVKEDDLRAKGFYESILYYMRLRRASGGDELKYIIITNMYNWCIIDAHEYDRVFWRNKSFRDLVDKFDHGQLSFQTTKDFYDYKIAPFVETSKEIIRYIFFNLYEQTFDNSNILRKRLDDAYRILSPTYLLKEYSESASKELDRGFYTELLHIMGLEEVDDNNKKIIRRKNKRNESSIIESAYLQFKSMPIQNLSRIEGKTTDDKIFNASLQLSIIWVNRLLFLKLLEAQLMNFHKGDNKYKFLTCDKIRNFKDLDDLFFLVLALPEEQREKRFLDKFPNVPYLNSSLFEPDKLLEGVGARISGQENNIPLPLCPGSILKDYVSYIKRDLSPLEYIIYFLDSYNFGCSIENDQEINKPLISASVLGLIFEKINGYKDGSIFTPPKVTMGICRKMLEQAVIDKFKITKGFSCENFTQLYNELNTIDKVEANNIINSIRICDPAVGSGHFLVSALNEMISIKSRLDILIDKDGKILRDYNIDIIDDELIIKDEDDKLLQYHQSKEYKGSQRIQEVLFNEKKNIIENCLYGVDINKNSVNICCLRLWIELLKNTYYDRETGRLQTLPNIDINIKLGNSLISRFPVEVGETFKYNAAFGKSVKFKISRYKKLVNDYKNNKNKEKKDEISLMLNDARNEFRQSIQMSFLKKNNIENNYYSNSMEWMIEFPELLDDEARFLGFDVIIGNPPYINMQDIKDISKFYKKLQGKGSKKRYTTYDTKGDILYLFIELGRMLVRDGGIIGFIVSNSWMRAQSGKNLRKFLSEKTNPLFLIDFEHVQVFPNVTVETNILIYSRAANTHKTYARIVDKDEYNKGVVIPESGYVENDFSGNGTWFILTEMDKMLLSHFKNIGVSLDNKKKWNLFIRRGVTLGKNDAFIVNSEKRKEIIDRCADDNEKERTNILLKKLIRGEDVRRYNYFWDNLYLITMFPSKKEELLLYPSIEKHLLSFEKDRLLKTSYKWIAEDENYLASFCKQKLYQDGRRKVMINNMPIFIDKNNKPEVSRKKTKHNWFETSDNTAFWEKLTRLKLIWKRIGSDVRFTYDEKGIIPLDSCCFAIGKHIKYLCAFFNSNLGKYILKFSPKTGTGDSLVSVQAFKPICVPIPSEDDEKNINEKVDLLSEGTNEVLKEEIDKLIYKISRIEDKETIMYIESKI